MMIPISDANGNRIEISFTDVNTLLPITNIPFDYDDMEPEEVPGL